CAPFEGGAPPFGCLVGRRHSWLARGRASAFGCLVARRPSWLALGRASAFGSPGGGSLFGSPGGGSLFGSPGAVRCLARLRWIAVWFSRRRTSRVGCLGSEPLYQPAWPSGRPALPAGCGDARGARWPGHGPARARAASIAVRLPLQVRSTRILTAPR